MRIVSLLASGTEILYGLGLGETLVGISHECDYPPTALTKPRVSRPRFDPDGLDSAGIDRAVRSSMAQHGSVYEVDVTLLRDLEPDLILTQAVCEVCAVPTSLAHEAAAALGGRARVLSLDAHTLAQILASIRHVAEATGVPERADRYVASLEARIAAVTMSVTDAPRPGVLALEWLAPPFIPGHWTPETIAIAGGANLKGSAGQPSREVSWNELSDLDPQVLVIMPCGYGLEAARADADRHAAQLLRVAERAVAAGRAFVVDGSAYFNRSGPRVVDGIEILAALLHRDRFEDYDLEGCAAWWRPALSGTRGQPMEPDSGNSNSGGDFAI